MADPVERKRKDGTIAYYSRVKLASGKWSSERIRAARNWTEAKKLNHELQEAEDRKAKGLAPGGSLFIGTFAELCDLAWRKHISTLSGSTSEASRLHIHGGAKADRDMLGPSPLGPMLAALVDAARLEEYFADLAPNPKLGRPKGLAASTINRIRATFSIVFETAQRFGKWPKGSNPAQETVERECDDVAIRTLTVAEIFAVLEYADPYWAGPFAVCLLAGLRRGEMLALKKEDVSLDESDDYPFGSIRVRRSATESEPGEPEARGARDTTKGKRHDTLPIHRELRPYLEHWLHSPSEWLFPDHDGNRRSENQRFDLRLQAAMVRAGIVDHYEFRCRRPAVGSRRRHGTTTTVGCPLRGDGKRPGYLERHPDDAARRCPGCDMRMSCTPKAPRINFHATRHSFATAMLESGATLQGVQKLMRHSDPRLTTEIYGHLAPSFLAGEVDRLARGTLSKRGKGRARLASAGQRRASETDSRMAPAPAAGASVTPLRRGPSVEVGLDDLAAESSIKKASGMVEPRGIEPLTYALRMQEPLGGTDAHRSQALASVDHFSPPASLSASHGPTPFATVSGALVTPVRRAGGAASHAGEGGRDMLEQASPALATGAQETATVLLSVADVAKRLRVSLKWVRYRIETGDLPVVRVHGTRWRVRESDVEAFLARMQR